MPFLQYKCPNCGKRFDELVKSYLDEVKCPDCGGALVKSARGNVKCNNKDCSYQVKSEKTDAKKAKKAPIPMEDDFTPPPLMDEPQYFDMREFDE